MKISESWLLDLPYPKPPPLPIFLGEVPLWRNRGPTPPTFFVGGQGQTEDDPQQPPELLMRKTEKKRLPARKPEGGAAVLRPRGGTAILRAREGKAAVPRAREG
ncbi:hypothetical protein EOD39_13276 [Acipenser ruthenus]|uniref:Uncharacterized protein n=1 Tax=Acipenser ruthenus TaxID=7906 RepID=A0A662YPC3_ACIRT|nr:hypothetical protein EOD39_13276 [Acipenser ruthenus]